MALRGNQVGKTTIGKLMVMMLGSDNATIIFVKYR